MDLENTARALSEIEVKTLKALASGKETIAVISEKAGIPLDSVRRALAWLEEKELAITGGKIEMVFFTEKGLNAIKKLPERKLVEALKKYGGSAVLSEIMRESEMDKPEFNAALGLAKRMNWVVFSEGKLELTGLEKEPYKIEEALETIEKKTIASESFSVDGEHKQEKILHISDLSDKEKECVGRLGDRDFIKIKKVKMSSNSGAEITELGKKALEIASSTEKRAYNISGEVPSMNIGKKQPYIRFLEQIRSKLVNMGFNEMETLLIVQEFYNFDVLFQPQNHPARTWTSTYQLKQPTLGRLPDKKSVKAVKEAHEFGANTLSKGWGYKWSEDIAKKLMPVAHGTAHSARQLIKGVDSPKKYFSIARCYRPDTVDRTHLIEFNQLEGIIVGDFSFKHLLGMLKEFAEEFAHAKKVKFYPDYYPFTSPSVQLSAKHSELGWVEFGGAGMFRPEMLEPLGIHDQVLAWGLGIDRLAMFKLGIGDIRELFSQKLDWLRDEKMVVLD